MKKPNLHIHGIQEIQKNTPAHIFQTIINENLPYLRKESPIQVHDAFCTLSRYDQNTCTTRQIMVTP